MRRGIVAIGWLVCGCEFDTGGNPAADADLTAPDRADDAAADDAGFDCAMWSPVPAHFDPCALAAPLGEIELVDDGQWVLDTTNGVLYDPQLDPVEGFATGLVQQPSGPMARYLSVDRFVVGTGAQLRVTGNHPLIVAAWDSISIMGEIDAGSEFPIEGPGSTTFSCGNGGGTQGQTSSTIALDAGGGGGGGGGFGTGGAGGGQGGDGALGGAGGGALTSPPVVVRPGCRGARGGTGSDGTGSPGGTGGFGGGGIQLTARSSIVIAGQIAAGGAGGAGAPGLLGVAGGGGGGAGSGGLIGLEAPMIRLAASAIVAANGGGGGEGGRDGDTGESGQNGRAGSGQALGGDQFSQAGDGGDGAARTSSAETGEAFDSGGGGGGGVGFIVVRSPDFTDMGAEISPAASSL